MFNDQTSHPLRMRGLKQRMIDRIKKEMEVASFTDAWIETIRQINWIVSFSSHPLRMRGLKPYTDFTTKQSGFVASFTDAWIETWWKTGAATWRTVASFTDAWIETTFIR